MNLFRNTALQFYRVATQGTRSRWLEQQQEKNDVPVAILFYHRIADQNPNAWTLSTNDFEQQLDWLASRFDFVSLEESQRRLREGNDRPCVAITFDDGYAENCEFAIPLLLRREIPFTYFVSTNIIRDQTAFDHDLEAGKRLPINSVEQIRAMADVGVEIGAHTRNHVDMGRSIDIDWIHDELVGSVEDLQAWIDRPVKYFAFPFGLPKNITQEAVAVAKQIGLKGICSAYGAYNFPSRVAEGSDAFHLRRIHADPEWNRFTNWMTFDSRKTELADPIDDANLLTALVAELGGCDG